MLACQDIAPAAVLLSSGIFSMSQPDFLCRPTFFHLLAKHAIASTEPSAWEDASPLEAVKKCKSFPPTVVLHGTADTMAPVGDSRALCNIIRNRCGHDDLLLHLEIPHGPHGWDYFKSGTTQRYAVAVDSFLSAHLN